MRSHCPLSKPNTPLSFVMHMLMPLRSMLQEIASGIKLPRTFTSTIKCQVFKDNNSGLLFAVNQRITKCKKYFQAFR